MGLVKLAYKVMEKEGPVAVIDKINRNYFFPYILKGSIKNQVKKMNTQTHDIDTALTFTFDKNLHCLEPFQKRSEIKDLITLLDQVKPQRVLEIGTARGGTLFLFSRVIAPDAKAISIDLPGGEFGGGYPTWKLPLYQEFAHNTQAFHFLRSNSHDPATKERVADLLNGEQLDFLFIDGDHTYEGVKTDFELYNHLVKKGGIIAFHDIVPTPPEKNTFVHEFWQEIKNSYTSKEFVEDWNQGWGGIGVIYQK